MRYNEIKLDSQLVGIAARAKAIWRILFSYKFVLSTITKTREPQGIATTAHLLALNTHTEDLIEVADAIYQSSLDPEQQEIIMQAYEILYPD